MGNQSDNPSNQYPTMGEDITGTIFSPEGNEGYSGDELAKTIVEGDEYSDTMAHYILGKLPEGMEKGKYYDEDELKDMIWDDKLYEGIDDAYSEASPEFGPNARDSRYIEEQVSNQINDSIESLVNKGYLLENENGQLALNPQAYATNFPVESWESSYMEWETFDNLYALVTK